ncbi:MAG: glutaminyl-peptide cyclotransferase [Anaerolineae bacterium]|nr:glutaminyl-peptide cyclotransferase [Anaerolineae bacterium]MDQ7036581.1 glutaminyl-peptide cyclotransferase [Anaerolineae bacterium]
MMKWLMRISIFSLLLIATSRIWGQDNVPVGFVTVAPFTVEIINEYPHDVTAFTQGIIWNEGSFYESTGQRGESTLREVTPTTGEIIRSIPVTRSQEQLEGDSPLPNYFAEGLELVGNQLFQLTWTAGEAFVYDQETFELVDTIGYESQGWGICYDGRYIYMSDSTQYLAIREPDTFDLVARQLVTFNGQPIAPQLLNELECVGDSIYANLWPDSPYAAGFETDYIVQIDKYTGNVTGLIDAGNLLTDEMKLEIPGSRTAADGTVSAPGSAVLNGIAYNPESDTFFITGKHWPRVFEVRFVPRQ